MNPATALARVLADELARCGVTEAVIAPGSRSGPLALALLEEPRIRVHVRIDERSAAFLALGLAAASRACVPVVCTSGTAAAALHPAVVEADASGVGLLVLSADRPPELRGTGASQTIDQLGLYGRSVRMFHEIGVPEAIPGQVAYWRSLVGRAVGACADGPVHLNVPLREPLTHDGDLSWCEPLDGRPDGAPWVEVVRQSNRRGLRFGSPWLGEIPERGVVVVGDNAANPLAAVALAEAFGWPLLAEPASGARQGPNAIAGYPLLLAEAADLAPELVISVGAPGLSRSVLAYLRTAERHIVVDPSPRWADPTRTAELVLDLVPRTGEGRPPGPWLERWRELSKVVGNAIDGVLDEAIEAGTLPEPAVARTLGRALPSGALLVTGPSRSVRDLDLCLPARDDVLVLANRGANGIDGVVSTAIGAALAHQVGGDRDPAYALMGDLTYLYDRNGLVLGPDEPRPDLTVVVVDNDGGGIFSMLPQAGVAGFERVFGTPHSLDLVADAIAAGIPATSVGTAVEFDAALAPAPGLRVVRVRTDRGATAELHRRLQKAVAAALR